MIDATSSAAFVWLALSTVSSSDLTQTAANVELPLVALLPASPQTVSSSPMDPAPAAYPVRNRQSSMIPDPMKTKASKITERSVRKLSSILAVASIFLGLSELTQAQIPTLFWDGPDE